MLNVIVSMGFGLDFHSRYECVRCERVRASMATATDNVIRKSLLYEKGTLGFFEATDKRLFSKIESSLNFEITAMYFFFTPTIARH